MMRDITIGQYYPADSILHRLDPRVKFIGTFLFLVSLFVADNFWGYMLATVFLAGIVGLSKVPVKFMLKGLKPLFLIFLIKMCIRDRIRIHGLKEHQLTIDSEALKEMITGYTKEAGVRNLERKIGEICRKTARKILEEKQEKVEVTKENLEEFLGRAKFTYQKKNQSDEIGIVRGLAWTSVGGDTLQIEVNLMPGKGEFLLTGQLGDVMKESAQAGISYIRSVAEEYHIESEFFQKHDLHIHIPEGAVPKDGPSAGITMATAMLLSLIHI